MRGKLVGNAVFVPTVRITPADAGKTNYMEILMNLRKDHPRGCGENATVEGNKPLRTRITPADAGKTG